MVALARVIAYNFARMVLLALLLPVAGSVHAQSSIPRSNQIKLAYNFSSVLAGTGAALGTVGYSVAEMATDSSGNIFWIDSNYNLGLYYGNGVSRVYQYNTPAICCVYLSGIATGPDGAVWLGETDTVGLPGQANYQISAYIDRVDSSLNLTRYPLPTAPASPAGLVAGPDGAIWFIESATTPPKIGRMTVQGVVTEFPPPTGVELQSWIVAGADGNLWMGGGTSSAIATTIYKMNTSGQLLGTYPLPAQTNFAAVGTHPVAAPGADGNVWILIDQFFNTITPKPAIARITPAGTLTTYPLPLQPLAVINGPDGALWFTLNGPLLGRMDTSGKMSSIAFPSTLPYSCQPESGNLIAVGPGSSLVFSAYGSVGGYNTDCYFGSVTLGASSLWPETSAPASPAKTGQLQPASGFHTQISAGESDFANRPTAGKQNKLHAGRFSASDAQSPADDCGDIHSCYISIYPSVLVGPQAGWIVEASVEFEQVFAGTYDITLNTLGVSSGKCTDVVGNVGYITFDVVKLLDENGLNVGSAGKAIDALIVNPMYGTHTPGDAYTCKIVLSLVYEDVESGQTTTLSQASATVNVIADD